MNHHSLCAGTYVNFSLLQTPNASVCEYSLHIAHTNLCSHSYIYQSNLDTSLNTTEPCQLMGTRATYVVWGWMCMGIPTQSVLLQFIIQILSQMITDRFSSRKKDKWKVIPKLYRRVRGKERRRKNLKRDTVENILCRYWSECSQLHSLGLFHLYRRYLSFEMLNVLFLSCRGNSYHILRCTFIS